VVLVQAYNFDHALLCKGDPTNNVINAAIE